MARMQLSKTYQTLILMAILVLIVTGCSTGISHFDRSYNVSSYFEQYQLLPDHKYYYFGRLHGPDAVVGIREGWTFQTISWQPLEPDEKQLRDLVERMQNTPGSEFNYEPNGAYIYNDSGETIGVWYSMWILPIMRFTGEKTFTISDPISKLPHNRGESDGDRFRSW